MDFSKISVTILVKNAQKTLLECLESLKSFDEIILLDNQSNDDTLKIATNFKENFPNLHIYSSEFIGFGPLKNLALSYTKNEWILSIDADEVLESSFLEELKNLSLEKENILALPRKNLYKGEWIKACGWYPDYVNRIFNKTFTHFNDNAVHESLICQPNTKIIKTQNGLTHYAYDSIYGLLEKCQKYSNLWAQQNLHKKSSINQAVIRSIWKFFRDYILKKGIFYGYKGFMISFCNALGVFFKYAKLYELTHKIPTCSLAILTQKDSKSLSAILDSIKKFKPLPNEVLIISDTKNTIASLIQESQSNFPCSLSWVMVQNSSSKITQAIEATKMECVIIIDDETTLKPSFIKDHLNFATHKAYLQGSKIIFNSRF